MCPSRSGTLTIDFQIRSRNSLLTAASGAQWSRDDSLPAEPYSLHDFRFPMTSVDPDDTARVTQGACEKSPSQSQHSRRHETSKVDSRPSKDQGANYDQSLVSPTRTSQGTSRVPLPDTPSGRTGPPRSLSFSFSHSNSASIPHQISVNGLPENDDILENDLGDGKSLFQPNTPSSSFRGAFELHSSLGQVSPDKKGKAKETRFFQDSPIEESPKTSSLRLSNDIVEVEEEKQKREARKPVVRHQTAQPIRKPTDLSPRDLQRSQSHPQGGVKRSLASAKWNKLRDLLPAVIRSTPPPPHSVVTSHEVNITDELIGGGLSVLMLGLWFQHDEKGHRRIPALLHRLRIRISDSLHPLHAHKAVFRIECEYANGAARWVIYRQLRDFISLHAHYSFSNAFSSEKDVLPEFPRTGKSCVLIIARVLTCCCIAFRYFRFLRKESSEGHVKQADFARLQRLALEEYLIKLIRAVVRFYFHAMTALHKYHFRCFTQRQTGLQASLKLAHYSSLLLSPGVRNIKLDSSASIRKEMALGSDGSQHAGASGKSLGGALSARVISWL